MSGVSGEQPIIPAIEPITSYRDPRVEAIFGVATRIVPQRTQSAGAAQMPFIAEAKRRNVFQVGEAYSFVAWLLAWALAPTPMVARPIAR